MFLLRRRPADPAIAWHGFGTEIFLHPACVLRLVVRLVHDVYELEKTPAALAGRRAS